MTRHQRITTFVLAGVLGAFGMVPVTSAAESTAVTVEENVAVLRVEIREADGTLVRAPTQAVQWGKTAAFLLSSDKREHQLDVTLRADAGVELRYADNGQHVAVEPAGQRARRQVYRATNGAEISLSVVTTRVRIEAKPS